MPIDAGRRAASDGTLSWRRPLNSPTSAVTCATTPGSMPRAAADPPARRASGSPATTRGRSRTEPRRCGRSARSTVNTSRTFPCAPIGNVLGSTASSEKRDRRAALDRRGRDQLPQSSWRITALPSAMTPIHVLVLERDPDRRDAVLGMLRGAGHHAAAAPDAQPRPRRSGCPGSTRCCWTSAWPDLDLGRLREALAPAEPANPTRSSRRSDGTSRLTLRYTGGNKRHAAHLLGISRSTLLHKVRKYGLAGAGALALTIVGQSAGARAQLRWLRCT